MKTLHVSVLASLIAVSPVVLAQPMGTSTTVTTSPGSGKAVQTLKTTATVVGIDPATRTVSLKRPDGQVVKIQAGAEVRNFDKIKLGDTVKVEYTQALSLDLKKGESRSPKQSESVHLARAPVGGQPSGTVGREVTVIADVVAVNRDDRVITLRGPEGNMVDLKVQDPEQLKLVKKGDQVKAVYSEALAVAVEPATTKK